MKGKAAKRGQDPKRPPDEPLEPWDRQPGESQQAFAGFTVYRDLPPEDRSLRGAARSRNKGVTQYAEWSSRFRWVERAKAWDLHQDRIRQRELEAEQIEAARRHAETSARALRATDRLVAAFLDKIGGKDGEKALKRLTAEQLATLAIQAARVQPRIIPAERLSLGLSTTNTGGHDGGPLDGDADARMATRSSDELRAFLLGAETAKALEAQKDPAE